VGYIDCDTHVWETDHTWAYLRPEEESFRPAVAEVATETGVPFRFWLLQDQRVIRNDDASPHLTEQQRALVPQGDEGLDRHRGKDPRKWTDWASTCRFSFRRSG
jgi:hypothetical protein